MLQYFCFFPSMLTTNALLQSVQISDDNHYFADQTEERQSLSAFIVPLGNVNKSCPVCLVLGLDCVNKYFFPYSLNLKCSGSIKNPRPTWIF